jgi:cell surface protein SprA
LQDGQINAVIRIGQDFLNNYYEIKIPLKITPFNTSDANLIWPAENNLDFSLQELVNLKLQRNSSGVPLNTIYRDTVGNHIYSVYGNPNLGEVRSFLIGIENPKDGNTASINTEVWINELRLSKLDEEGGSAALGRLDVQLADLGTLSVSANTYTTGFGTIEQRISERARNDMNQFDAAINIDAGKLFPQKAGFSIPVYASFNKTKFTPKYDPYDKDILYKTKLNASQNKDSVKQAALDQTTIKTLNFTNVRFAQPAAKPKLWSISNFDFSYSFTKIEQSSPIIFQNNITRHHGGFGYTYNGNPHYVEPFKKLIKNKTPWLALIRDFNFNYNPSLLGFRADIDRQYGEYVPRIVSTYDSKVERVDTTYDKYFNFDRYYNFRWDVTRSLNLDFSAINYARVDEPFGKLDTKAKKDSVRKNFWDGGRTVLYQQKAVLSYNLPFSKLPLTDWISGRYNYSANYNWIGASLLALNLGNTLENGKQIGFTGEFDFNRLYNKSKWLSSVSNAAPKNTQQQTQTTTTADTTLPTKQEVVKGLHGKARKEALRQWREKKRAARKAARQNKQVNTASGVTKTAVQLVTMVKRASVNYSENYYSRVPGYKDSTQILGQNWKTKQPGFDYIFGKQPDTAWLNKKAAQGVIVRDSMFNLLFRQTYEKRFSITAQLEPIRELIIDLNLDKSFSKEYTEMFKDTLGQGNFAHLNPLAAGGFSVSYISFKTLFTKYSPTEISETFKKFQDYRSIISQRLGQQNPYSSGVITDGYAQGYGRYAQDVLIPAFLAAYTGKSPNTVPLIKQQNPNITYNPFGGIKPKPNWRVTFTGLSKIPALSNMFSNITITHGYNGTLSMNSFSSALLFYDPLHYGAPAFIDTISGNYIPYFLIPNITIQEQFAPLFGIDVTTNSQLNLRFEFKKSRQLSLSLIDYQLSEVRSTEWTIGGNYRKQGVNLRLPGMKKTTPQGNSLSVRLDLSVRDDTQSNSRLDQASAYSTGGQKVVTIQPSIDYVLNERVNLQLYFDQQRITPYISTSAPIINTRGGIQIRISLAQ